MNSCAWMTGNDALAVIDDVAKRKTDTLRATAYTRSTAIFILVAPMPISPPGIQ
jgi:hypothetical protein